MDSSTHSPASDERPALPPEYERMLVRLALWIAAAATVFALDAATKAAPHPLVAYNHAHTPLFVLGGVGILLFVLGMLFSATLALGAGLMFGGLLGNGLELARYGYATDWIHIGHWLTNVADLGGALGLVCCIVAYVTPRKRAQVNKP